MRARILLFAAAACLCTDGYCTNRYYSDHTALSPNGRYEAAATSPDNKNGPYKVPFQRNFTIVLREKASGKVLWEYKQKKDEASPCMLAPTDDGYLVMRDAWDGYYVFDKQGTPKRVASPLEDMPKAEREKFTDETTAGVMWLQYSRQGFFADGDTTYFYLRTYWGRFTVIDFAAAKAARNAALEAKIEARVVGDVQAWLKTFNGEFYEKCPDCGGKHLREDLVDNLFIIKKHALPGGQKLLEDTLKRTKDGRHTDLQRYLDNL